MHSYFRLLSKLASVEETDASLMQLAYSISPTICRPLTCAYMSLRHKEDLNKIRPVILYLVENYADIFTFTRSFHMGSSAFSIDKDSREAMLSDMMATAMVIDPSSKSASGLEVRFISSDTSGSEDDAGASHSMPFIKPSLMLSIPGGGAAAGGNSTLTSSNSSLGLPASLSFSSLSGGGSSDDNDSTSSSSSSAMATKDWSYSDNDWKIFHALVCHKVSRFLDFNDRERQEYMQAEAEGDGHHAVMQAWTAKVNLALHQQSSTHTKLDPSGLPPNSGAHSPTSSPTHASGSSSSGTASSSSSVASGTASSGGVTSTTGGGATTTGSLGSPPIGNSILQKKHSPKSTMYAKSYARRNKRRKMVAECKGLRAQIQEFEQAFLMQHARMPKAQERGDMHQFYVKYRELKKEIRETAAKDMQRVARGFLSRRRVLRMVHGSFSDDAAQVAAAQLAAASGRHISPDAVASGTDPVMVVSPREGNTVISSNQNTKPGVISSSSAAAAAASYGSSTVSNAATATNATGPALVVGGSISATPTTTSVVLPVSPGANGATNGGGGGASLPQLSLQLNTELCTYRPSGQLDEDTMKFRELLYAKRDLKRMLKKFDSDFVDQFGRQPKKADKESMRPMYQKYQEIKTSIEILRVHMQNYEGQVPEDLRAEVFGSGSAAVSPTNQSSTSDRRNSVGSVSSISSSMSAQTTISGSQAVANGNADGGDVDMIVVEDLPAPTAVNASAVSGTGTSGAAGKTTRQAFTTPASTTTSATVASASGGSGSNSNSSSTGNKLKP